MQWNRLSSTSCLTLYFNISWRMQPLALSPAEVPKDVPGYFSMSAVSTPKVKPIPTRHPLGKLDLRIGDNLF